MKKAKPLLHDHQIIERVKQYLEENIDKTYLDVTEMTKHLQQRYPEYARRKIAPFRALVEQAYNIVSQRYTMSPSSSEESDLELMEDVLPASNVMNSVMSNLYAKGKTNPPTAFTNQTKPAQTTTVGTSEAIDISSEDSSDGAPNKNGDRDAITKIASVPIQNIAKKFGANGAPKSDEDSRDNSLQFNKKRKLEQTAAIQYRHNVGEMMAAMNERSSSRPKKYKKEVVIRKVRGTFQDIGGMEKTLKELCEILIHVKMPDMYFVMGLMPPRGILIHGPTGCGKTLLANSIAGQLNIPLIDVTGTELIAGISGESEERIRDVFDQAALQAPCVLFIDEIDAISTNRALAQKDMERRVVSQLIHCFDSLKQSESGQSVLVVGATTRPDVIDPALRRVGRFDHEIAINIPSRKDRKEILSIICEGLAVEPKLDYDRVAELTPGYVGADLLALVSRAATIAAKNQCINHLKEVHAKKEANIQYVDLDADESVQNKSDQAEPEGEEAKKDEPSDDQPEASASTSAEPEKDKAAVEEKTETDNVEKKSNEIDEETMEVDTSLSEAEQKPTEKTDSHESTETVETPETLNANGPDPTTAEVPAVVSAAAPASSVSDDQAPSLFDWINWLDSPPDDFAFISNLLISFNDFIEAIKVMQPSAKREGFITVPDVTWDDIGSLHDIREELKLAVLAPVKHPELLERMGMSAPSGVLLCGPPGCGKTLLAKAIANEAGINFISVKGPELMNMYVGESERAVRACFQRARNSAPCVIFFDEFDSLCPKRSETGEGGSGTRVVNQLLTEMDGIVQRQGVYILAATNRPDIIDPAILRPGRLDTILYVGFPEAKDRVEIFKATTRNGTRPAVSDDVSFEELAQQTEGYTGADLAGIVKKAAMLAVKEVLSTGNFDGDVRVQNRHFEVALRSIQPSVTAQDRKVYEKLRQKYGPRQDGVDSEA